MSDSPPPAYSPIEDDPFIDNQSVFVPAQPPFTQPDLTQFIDPRIRYDYVCPDPGIVDSWGVASTKILHVPGGICKAHRTWEDAVAHYTKIYRNGGIKVMHPRLQASTPGRSASTPVVIHSAAPTPSPGVRIRPIEIISSPAPTTPSHTPGQTTITQSGSITPGAHLNPITVTGLLITTPVRAPGSGVKSSSGRITSTPTREQLNEYIDRMFVKVSAARAGTTLTHTPTTPQSSPSKSQGALAGPSMVNAASWLDPTPISIPRARLFASALPQDGRDPVPTVSQDGHDRVHTEPQDGRDRPVFVCDESDSDESDDEYFKDFPLSPEELAAIAELDDVLAEPRFA